MWSGNLVPGSGFAFIINWGHSLIGGADYLVCSSCSASGAGLALQDAVVGAGVGGVVGAGQGAVAQGGLWPSQGCRAAASNHFGRAKVAADDHP